jgi:branched-chain amino acid aminotransferase
MKENEMLIYINGKYFPESEAVISVFDHGFLYGDGVFEGIRIDDGAIFRLDEHIDRLYMSAQYIKLRILLTKQEMKQAIVETARHNKLMNGYIRPLVSRGEGPLGIESTKQIEKPTVVIFPRLRSKFNDAIRLEVGLKAKIVSTRRNPPECLDTRIKSCNYLNNILAKMEVWDAGADMGIMFDIHGHVSEGCAENIFLVKNNLLYTPKSQNTLNGITRCAVIEVAKKNGIPVFEADLNAYDLFNADEVFLTGTMTELVGIVNIDGRIIGEGKPGPMTKKILYYLRQLMVDEKEKFLAEFPIAQVT